MCEYVFFTSEFRYLKWTLAHKIWGIGHSKDLEQTYSYSNAQTKSLSCRIKVSISLTPLLLVFYIIVLLMFVYPAPVHMIARFYSLLLLHCCHHHSVVLVFWTSLQKILLDASKIECCKRVDDSIGKILKNFRIERKQ